MSGEEIVTYLENKYVGKRIVICCDLQKSSNKNIGKQGTVHSIYREDGAKTVVTVLFDDGNSRQFYLGEIELAERENVSYKEVKIEFSKKTIEEVDEFGNSYILQLLPPEEKFIYLSSALRTLLNIKDGDYINFAFDKGSRSYYICKETDSTNGYLVQANKIESVVEWRNLYNTFNFETTKIEDAKLKFHVSHYEREQQEYPEYSLFLINEPWIEVKKEKKVKETQKREAPTIQEYGNTYYNDYMKSVEALTGSIGQRDLTRVVGFDENPVQEVPQGGGFHFDPPVEFKRGIDANGREYIAKKVSR